jgi:hypothetical protein
MPMHWIWRSQIKPSLSLVVITSAYKSKASTSSELNNYQLSARKTTKARIGYEFLNAALGESNRESEGSGVPPAPEAAGSDPDL